jgi:hypothetical protein
MNTCSGIARRCDNSVPRPFVLVGITGKPIRRLCDACRDAADSLGYLPAATPEWRARGVGKDLTGALVA